MTSKEQRKPLGKGFIDPLDTSKKWRPQGVREIFGQARDVFGIRKKKDELEDDSIEIEEDKNEGEDEDDDNDDNKND
jgi:hypothetical protein